MSVAAARRGAGASATARRALESRSNQGRERPASINGDGNDFIGKDLKQL